MTVHVDFVVHRAGVSERVDVEIDRLVIAGWTGRNRVDVDQHIQELAKIGVRPPASVPVFYRASIALLTQASAIEVIGNRSSGEAEFYLLGTPRGVCVGVGSDHTDRQVETYDISVSKQMCAKPISRDVWLLSELVARWDNLLLESYVTRKTERVAYQSGRLADLLPPSELVRRYTGYDELPIGTLMFGGTVPVLGEVSGGDRFEVLLVDPTSTTRLEHSYDVVALPLVEASTSTSLA